MKNTTNEKWVSVLGYDGLYEVSDLGNVKSTKFGKEKIMKQHTNRYGYCKIDLLNNTKRKKHSVHRLVAIAFLENPENKLQVNHKNGIKSDNRLENIEFNTRKENMNHARKNGLTSNNSGKQRLTEKDVIDMRRLRTFLPTRELAIIFNVSVNQVISIINRRSWKLI